MDDAGKKIAGTDDRADASPSRSAEPRRRHGASSGSTRWRRCRWPRPPSRSGNFDGVHRGHQALVAAAVRRGARRAAGTAVVLTFDPHPVARARARTRAPATLMTLDQKAEALAALGVRPPGRAALHARARARRAPAEFARSVLRERAGRARGGGRRRTSASAGAGRATLAPCARLGRSLGFAVVGMPPVLHEGAPISSSRIREALARGRAWARPARCWAGRSSSTAASCAARAAGARIGIPTANLAAANETLPARGVYAAGAGAGRRRRRGRPAVVNVGRRPTFGGGRGLRGGPPARTSTGDLYGRTAAPGVRRAAARGADLPRPRRARARRSARTSARRPRGRLAQLRSGWL